MSLTTHRVPWRCALALCLTALAGAGCSVSFRAQPADGGVFRSADHGTTWQQTVFVSRTKDKLATIGGLGITELQFSPLNSSVLYAAAAEGRLYRSENRADQWTRIFNGEVRSFAPHPTEASHLYLTSQNQILETTDGGATWQVIYIEGTVVAHMNTIAIDRQNPKVLYAGTSQGLLLRSVDGGKTWRLHHTFEHQNIKRIVVNPHDGKIMYVVFGSGALWRSADAGSTWEDLTARLREVLQLEPGPVKDLTLLPNQPDGVLLATQYGLFRSFTGGGSWENIKLVTAPNAVILSALGVSPTNEQAMYYSADGAFYRTTDSGKTWQTVPLPSPHPATSLAIEPKAGAAFYLGFAY